VLVHRWAFRNNIKNKKLCKPFRIPSTSRKILVAIYSNSSTRLGNSSFSFITGIRNWTHS